jgi:hypothetical protein
MKAVALALTALALAGCNRGIENKEAVRQGVIDYLANRKNLNVGSMNVSVTAVTFKQNEAEATVAFAPKGSGGSAQGMTMRYTLERQGSRWVVKQRSDSGQHGAGMPGMGGMGEMPPGHPSVPAPKK